jgi:hypothetical protein
MIQYTKEYIGQLLERYMEGISTLEEEDILHQFFTRSDVPAEWEDYRQLFQEIEAMKPQPKTTRRWMGWSAAAAAIVAGILYLAIPSPQPEHHQALTAQSDTTTARDQGDGSLDSVQNHGPVPLIFAPQPKHQQQAPSSTKRRLRKPQPTMTDYDKAYALMAEASKEQQQAEQEMEQAQQEILHAQLKASGYVAIQQEDGTIIYTNEPKEYFAYEE